MLLWDGLHMTTELVARYYEVGIEAIKSLVKDNREELEVNGYQVIEGEGLRSFKDLNRIDARRSLAIFSRRAILNVGMLLRDSPAAPVNEEALTESRELRQRYTGRTDVLDKVKALQLLPDDAHATTELVAAYYEVPVKTIEKLVERNREELENNGYRLLKGAELREFKAPDMMSGASEFKYISQLAIYSRRAILNVGMLLRDSPIAQRVRTYLLDAEEAGQCLTVGAGLRECDEGSSQAVAIPDPGGAHAATFPGDRP